MHFAKLPGKPDIAFPKHKVAVFVDGCFWHGCTQCCRIPQTNRDYWETKISRNVARAQSVNRTLHEAGWTVWRLWEHEVRTDLPGCVAKIHAALSNKHIEK